ncbi:MAG: DUF2844 domain-containing protein [Candidatus Korobacteraceae bacterium]
MKALSLHRGAGILLAQLLLLMVSLPAWAALGDNAASVLTDQSRMKGTLRSADHRTYVLHEITTPSGAKVREFVSPGGAVFGLAWDGQFPPNFQQLLGPYFQQAQQAQQAKREAQEKAATDAGGKPVRGGRGPTIIETPGLVLYQTGHMRSFHGLAYIPQLVPQGVETSEIH